MTYHPATDAARRVGGAFFTLMTETKPETFRLETCLQFFPGFFHTAFSTSEEDAYWRFEQANDPVTLRWVGKDRGERKNDQEISCALDSGVLSTDANAQYEAAVCKAYAEAFFEDLGMFSPSRDKKPPHKTCNLVGERRDSPRFYNFENDRLNVYLDIDTTRWPKFVKACVKRFPSLRGYFNDYIRRKFTSYDGFMSFFSNDPDEAWTVVLTPWEEVVRTGYKRPHDPFFVVGMFLECLWVCALQRKYKAVRMEDGCYKDDYIRVPYYDDVRNNVSDDLLGYVCDPSDAKAVAELINKGRHHARVAEDGAVEISDEEFEETTNPDTP